MTGQKRGAFLASVDVWPQDELRFSITGSAFLEILRQLIHCDEFVPRAAGLQQDFAVVLSRTQSPMIAPSVQIRSGYVRRAHTLSLHRAPFGHVTHVRFSSTVPSRVTARYESESHKHDSRALCPVAACVDDRSWHSWHADRSVAPAVSRYVSLGHALQAAVPTNDL
eukprot:CAMPEP_0181337490 /NCGR_PEP_ID=MMETSP1101-20121128/28043_1 /TAXON_ID=46948 /ORGANISM="Rhodomonas abbreviata, Strain Caron Lab Isolate" /LENGTH=166 /DNA_ID=CAMNT_0023447981 /DNA_START=1946 /DNA_END=2447 /DNA_ORIENTATION=+